MSGKTPEPGAQSKPWPYRADRPQRYTVNYARYQSLGGRARLDELVDGFVSSGMNQSDMARFYFFCLAFDQLAKEGLEGDLAELGTYKGNTATLLAAIARELGKTAYILDTFEGFNKSDLKGIDSAAKATAFSDTSLHAVRALVGEDQVRFIKGYFPETAAELPADGRYCLVHIDCDLYAPIKSALEYFYPRMVPGGFLIVHDYSSLYWNGAEKAVDEFFADKLECLVPLPDSAGSVVARKARLADSNRNWLIQKRAGLLRDEWVQAGNGGLSELLGTGWSGPENWGVWGVGEAHELHLAVQNGTVGEIELHVDVHVLLAGERSFQGVDVMLAGEKLAEWSFVPGMNRGVRSVRIAIPHELPPRAGFRQLTLVFRPLSVVAPIDLDPKLPETRPIGVALHRLRCVFNARRGT